MNKWQLSKDAFVAFAEFLAHSPPGSEQSFAEIFSEEYVNNRVKLIGPELQLFCSAEKCRGIRLFSRHDPDSNTDVLRGLAQFVWIVYFCRNCCLSSKRYALRIKAGSGVSNKGGSVLKVGEDPAFFPIVPDNLDALITHDRDLFMKGLEDETHNRGIGAAGYYRRVVQNQAEHLLDQMGAAAEKLGIDRKPFDGAKTMATAGQFQRAFESVKAAVPPALLIHGQHNPFTLLWKSLSDDLHNRDDDECLEIATDTRLVMTDMAERMASALQDQSELDGAVTRLMKRMSSKAAKKKSSPTND